MRFAVNALAVLAALPLTADAAVLGDPADPGHGNREVSDNDRGHSLQLDSRSLNTVEAAAEERLCSIPIMTKEVWEEKKDDIDAWMRGILQRYRENPGNSKSFFSFILETNFPSIVSSQTACDIINECSPVSCNHFREILEGESQEKFEHERAMAIYASNALTNFHNFFRYVLEAFNSAADTVDRIHESLWRDFSWLDNQAAHEKKKEQEKKQLQAGLAIGLLLVLLINAVTAAGLGAASMASMVNVQQSFMANLANNLASAVYAGGLSVWSNQPVHKNPISPELLKMGEFRFDRLWADAATRAQYLLQNTTMGLMEAQEDGPNGKNVVDSLKEMGFYFPLDRRIHRSLTEVLEKELLATSINLVWEEDTTNAWIVRSDVPPGKTCEQDDRMHSMARVCLPDDPQSVYYVAATDSFNDQYLSEIHFPPGWRTLIEDPMKYRNITTTEVVASSVRWWRETHNHRFHHGNDRDGFNVAGFLDRIDRLAFSSIHLPVCNSPRGEALTSLNQKARLTYPCVCSKMDGSTDDFDSRKSETFGVLMTSGLIARDKVWTHCKETMDCSGMGGNPWKVNPSRKRKGKNFHKGWVKEVFTTWGPHALDERNMGTWGNPNGWDDKEIGV